MAEPSPVYDPEDEAPVTKPNLRKIEGGGHTTERKTGHLRSVGDSGSQKKLSSDELGKAESSSGGLSLIKGGKSEASESTTDTPDPTEKKFISKVRLSQKQKKGLFIGGGAVAGIVGILIAVLAVLVPLKIEHIINNLENRFFSSAESSVENETENIFKNYVKQILKVKGHCAGIVTRNCTVNFANGSNPVSNLYRTWQQNKLEDKLAADYGIEFAYDSSTNKYYMKAPGMTNPEVQGEIKPSTLEDPNADLFKDFSEVSRQDIRNQMRSALKKETLWNRVMLRFKVGRLLEEKYGIKRCIVFCKGVDALQDAKAKINGHINAKLRAANIYLIDRVIKPRNVALAISMKCILLGAACDPEKTTTQENCTVGVDCETNGNPVSPNDTEMQQALQSVGGEALAEDSATLVEQYQLVEDAGGLDAAEAAGVLDGAILEAEGQSANEALDTGVTQEAESASAADALPIIGWIQLANQIVGYLKDINSIGPKLKKLTYETNAAGAVGIFILYRSYSDEIKSGHANSDEVGSFTNSLGPGFHADNPNDPEKGGDATAEAAPLYSSLLDNSTQSPATGDTAGSLASIGTAAAANPYTTTTNHAPPYYKCQSGNPPGPNDKNTCPEEKLGGCNADGGYVGTACTIFDNLHTILSNPIFSLVFAAHDIWQNTVGIIFNFIGDVISLITSPILSVANDACSLPSFLQGPFLPYCAAMSTFKTLGSLMTKVLISLIPNPFGSNMSGGRTFDMMAAGADVGGNDYAHNGLGGVQLTPQQAAQVQNEQLAEQQYEFQHQSFANRVFSTSSQFSLVSRLAMSVPFGTGTTAQSIASDFFSNPFHSITSSITSLFTSHASAAAYQDPFGVLQYGYPSGTIPVDAQGYWDQNCADNPNLLQGKETTNYNNYSQNNVDGNGMPLNSYNPSAPDGGTDPCLLIQSAIGSDGALFNDQLLTPDDLADTTGNPATIGNYYQIGDSLSVGMQQAGLSTDLTNRGYNVAQIEANTGDTIPAAQNRLANDTANIKNATTVVVELGTNDLNDSASTIQSQIQSMIAAIKAINPSAKIYWVNTYSSLNPNYATVNSVIASQSTALGYTVIDWANEVTSNPGKYAFDPALGVHPTGTGYQNMATFVSGQIPKTSSAPTAYNGRKNVVAEAILGTQTSSKPSVFASIKSAFDIAQPSPSLPAKNLNFLWDLKK